MSLFLSLGNHSNGAMVTGDGNDHSAGILIKPYTYYETCYCNKIGNEREQRIFSDHCDHQKRTRKALELATILKQCSGFMLFGHVKIRAYLILLAVFICLPKTFSQTVEGIFPPVMELSKSKPVNASSTCGITNDLTYCMSSRDNSSITNCVVGTCRLDCCSKCGRSTPTAIRLDLGVQTNIQDSTNRRPGGSGPSKSFQEGSSILYRSLQAANVPAQGFTVSAWLKQDIQNTGSLITKGASYALVVGHREFSFYYTTRDASNIQRTLTLSNVEYQPGRWQHVALVVYSQDLSVFVDGTMQRSVQLLGIIDDKTADTTVGNGRTQYRGLIQDVKYYSRGLSNREITEAMNSTLPTVYGYSYCRCPPSHPRISPIDPFFCMKNQADARPLIGRLSTNSHPPEYAVDNEVLTHWISDLVENVTISIDLVYEKLQVFLVQLQFYSPPPQGILIERSLDHGNSYLPWQYFADDCSRMFGLPNNGRLDQPDSVNCLTLSNPKSSWEILSFQTQEPGPENKPQRPFGDPNCQDFHCSTKLLEFVKATNVRLKFYKHTLVQNPRHRYFGIRKLVVGGTCDCYGHGRECKFFQKNNTHNASYSCVCDQRTNTEGAQCEVCKPLYKDKPFKRGTILNAYPCKKCQCYDHADSCRYDQALDANPSDRSSLGGGVCIDCKHNTMGRFCGRCKALFYRPQGKAKNAVDVCVLCNCVGPGVIQGQYDCQKDDTTSGVLAGQCKCKQFVTGRQCTECNVGYFNLTSSNLVGCSLCGCNTDGTQSGDRACHISTGQCNCKRNVDPTTIKCTQCKATFYGLSASNPEGCSPCNCDKWGAQSVTCDKKTGQCVCKPTTSGRKCDACKNGFFGLNQNGCQPCRCNDSGTDPAFLSLCDKTSGQCRCKEHTNGTACDQCRSGHYGLSKSLTTGCLPCNCDTKGTIGGSVNCNQNNGTCSCKLLVRGQQCNLCAAGTFNLSRVNELGCTRCSCNPKGTVGGDTTTPDLLSCSQTGQCTCISNVIGLKCDSCVQGFFWNPNGPGCVSCSCDLSGSVNANCNSTGFCTCKSGNGVGGRRCDSCLPGFFNFNRGLCSPCGCSSAGSLGPECDSSGRCLRCKRNVEGTKCDRCKPGTARLEGGNPYGCSGAPSQQSPPQVVNLGSRAFGISWSSPDNPNGLVLRYILYRNNTAVYNGTALSFNDTRLTPYTLYNYYVVAVTAGGSAKSVDSDVVYRTLPDKPGGITKPEFSDIRERSVIASWRAPLFPNGIILRYILISSNAQNPSIERYRGLALSYQVTGLLPYTVYNFTLHACTSVGCSSSPAASIATRSAAPDSQPAPYVKPLSGGRSVFVYWDPPPKPNGRILFYNLFVRNEPFVGEGSTVSTRLDTSVRNYTVTNLTPYTSYQFRVVSFTSQVKGDTSSNWTQTRTLEDTPNGADAMRPVATVRSSEAVNVSWALPSQPNGVINKYEVYRYEQSSGFVTPNLSVTTTGLFTSALVSGLSPYTVYYFSVRACNRIGCTSYSPRIRAQTMPSAPSQQGMLNGSVINASSIRLSWLQPKLLNGPLPLRYIVMRKRASWSYPPAQVEGGIRFPSSGFYQFAGNLVPSSAFTQMEFFFKTFYTRGLIFFATSSDQKDIIAIELKAGVPWFIFDAGEGPTSITPTTNQPFNDGKWHKVSVTRNRKVGSITVDDTFTGSGVSRGPNEVIAQSASVYIGGVPSDLVISWRDVNGTVLRKIPFFGCIRNFKYRNTPFDFRRSENSANVSQLHGHCPSSVDRGIHFKGNGFLVLPNRLLNFGRLLSLSFSFKTSYLNGLLVYAHGSASNSVPMISLFLKDGSLTLFSMTASGAKNLTLGSRRQFCDGSWHLLSVVATNSSLAIRLDSNRFSFPPIQSDLVITSNIYLGGIPRDSISKNIFVRRLGHETAEGFGGCIASVGFSAVVDVQGNFVDFHNIAFDACPKTSRISSCTNEEVVRVFDEQAQEYIDKELNTFTEYLYKVRSYRSGVSGFADSLWTSVRSGEGAPSGLSAPVVRRNASRYVEVEWNVPEISGGLITRYELRAYDMTSKLSSSVSILVTGPVALIRNITNLVPYTRYAIILVVFTSAGDSQSPPAMAETIEAGPEELGPPTVVPMPTALNVSWQPPRKPNGKILFYQLDVDGNIRYNGMGFNMLVSNLRVYTQYTLRLTVCNGIACTFAFANVFTGQLPPEGVQPPSLRVLGSRRMEVTWVQPAKLNGVIRLYEILLAQSDNESAFKLAGSLAANILQLTLHNLIAGTRYFVRLRAYTAGGGTTSNSSSARTEESAPEDIPPPIAVAISAHAINVTIIEPLKPNGNIILYVLYQDGKVVMNGTSRNYIGRGFLPFSMHTYRTRVYTAKGFGESDMTVVYTLDAAPTGSIVLTAKVLNATSFEANWTAIQVPNGRIQYKLLITGNFYRNGVTRGELVDYVTEHRVKTLYNGNATGQSIVLSGLLPFSNYTGQVNGSNRAGFVLSRTVQLSTPGTVPYGVKSPNVSALNATAAEVLWIPPGRANDIQVRYELYIVYPKSDSGDASREVKLIDGRVFQYSVYNLEPYSQYQFKVVVLNSFGRTSSQWTNLTTPEFVPEGVDSPKVTNIESRSVFVTISPPAKANGKLIHYILYANGTLKNTTTHLTVEITGLLPFTVYVFQVAACTSIGCTRSAETKPTRTLEDVPENQPPPSLIANSSRSVVITWKAPQITNGIIVSYLIERRITGQRIFTRVGIVNVSSSLRNLYIDRTVKPWTFYDFRIIAQTAVGGTPSPPSTIRIPQGEPEGIAAPVAVASSPSSINVSWSVPQTPNGIITHYYVKAAGQRHLIDTSAPRLFVIRGLQSYIEYDVVISACTPGGCGDSLATKVRTLPSAPADQPSPTANVLSSSSLRVRWVPPRSPNGPILLFLVQRKTVEDEVSPNRSQVGIWKEVFRGLRYQFDDNNLGIYSLHQYMVTVVTTMGNTTSHESSLYRTAAEPPLSGVILSAVAFSHTMVYLNWTLPHIRLLRGAAQRFTIFYERRGGALHNFGTVNGDRRNIRVSNLLPSTSYIFKVRVFNGVGEKDSLPFTTRTLDGAPEGFDAPSVTSKSATEIRVSWKPPRIPNGRITNYTIYANGKRFDTVSGTTTLHVQGGLRPYTDYAIQVQVCTVYSCLKSSSSSVKTPQASPANMAAPILTPVSSSSVEIRWSRPKDENGVMIGYMLFRRKIYECPKPPAPKRKCTYIACPLSMELCGTKCYNPKLQHCCQGTLHQLDSTKTCCGTNYLKKNSASDVCCGGQFYPQQTGYQCCFNFYRQIPSDHICCRDNRNNVAVGSGNRCCGGLPYDINGNRTCICNQLFTKRIPAIRKCCGGIVVAVTQQCCGDETSGAAYDFDNAKKCCGTQYIEKTNTLCCTDDVGNVKIYNSSLVDQKCCGLSKISTNQSCCTNRSYDNSSHVCADRSSFTQHGCGSGRVCPVSLRRSALCNRCDFDPTKSFCGSVNGYFNPNEIQNTSAEICHSSYSEILKNSVDPTRFIFLDTGLLPHTQYEYYVVAINTIGSVNSSSSTTRTLMARPEGLSRPVPHVISDTKIAVTWAPPSTANGKISAYKLYRINVSTKKEILVYSGLALSHTDNQGLQPNTGYLYKISMCTVLCANITAAAVVYTRQARPEGVLPPVLTPVSSSSIAVNWSKPTKPNGIIVRYNVSRLVNNSYISILSPSDLGLGLTTVVHNLKPYTFYTFKVIACTVIGCAEGPASSTRTLEAPPEFIASPYLTIINSRAVEIEWRRPQVLNGRLRFYLVYRNSVVIYNGTSLIHRDLALLPNTLYVYLVEAFTYGGGRKSAPANVTTPESSPEGIMSPVVTAQSSTALFVSWSRPGRPNGVITRYSVIYGIPGSDKRIIPAQLRTNITLTSLKAYTVYEVRIEACTNQGCGTGNKTTGRTLEAPPEGQDGPTFVIRSSSVIDIKWKMPRSPNGIITRFELLRRLGNSGLQFIVFIGKTMEYIDTGLKAYTVYQYRIRSRNSVGVTDSEWVQVKTKEGIPANLDPPRVHVISGVTVHVSWQKPTLPNGVIKEYEIRVRPFSAPDRERTAKCCIKADIFNVSISNLNPSTSYEFRVAAVNGAGRGFSGWTVARTKESPPTGLPKLQANTNPFGKNDGESMKVFWNPPSRPNGAITGYTLYLDNDVVYQGMNREVTVGRLKPYTKYTFWLKVCNLGGCTTGNKQTLLSGESSPKGQAPPTFGAVNATSVTLVWKPPLSGNGQIAFYEVLRRKEASSSRAKRSTGEVVIYRINGTNATSYSHTDSGLDPFTTYGYKIRSRNSVGAVDSDWVVVKTAEGPPSGVPMPTLLPSSYSVEVRWNLPSVPNGIIRYYIVYRNGTNIASTSGVTYTDRGLIPATLYVYAVAACSSGGCTRGLYTATRTSNAAPGSIQPPSLAAVSSRGIKAQWVPPDVPNGEVRRYQLRLTSSEQPVYEGTALQYTLLGLQPYTSYTFTVAACTLAACTRSTAVSARTFEAPPENMASPQVFVRGSKEVEAVWTTPGKPHGVIIYYVLLRDGNPVYNGTDFKFIDRTVLPGRRYGYAVRAVNSAGSVTSSLTYSQATNPSIPENMTAPVLSVVNSSAIKVSWFAPGQPNGIIDRYYVVYSSKVILVGKLHMYTILNLQPYTLYDVRIRACTAGGCGTGPSASIRTAEAPPAQQLAPVFDSAFIFPRRVRIQWTPPRMPNGEITAYELQRRRGTVIDDVIYRGLSLTFTDANEVIRPNKRYDYRVTSFNSVGSITSAWSSVTTKSSPPDDVQAITVNAADITSTGFIFYITQPLKPYGVITAYTLEVINVRNISMGLQVRGEVANLEPARLYGTRLQACNAAGCSYSAVKNIRTLPAAPSGFSTAPRIISKTSTRLQVTWNEPEKANGRILWYLVHIRFSCPQSILPSLLCKTYERTVNSSLSRALNVTKLRPFLNYYISVTVQNTVGFAKTPEVMDRTLEEAPILNQAPNASVAGNTITIDWTHCFDLRSQLIEFVLEENNIQAYTGNKYVVSRPNREVGVYSYMVTAKTFVGGNVKSITTARVSVEVGDVSPSVGTRTSDSEFYRQVWFYVLMVFLAIVLLLLIIALILKKCTRRRTVYIREREPLPPRPSSKLSMGPRSVSRSTLDIGSEKAYPNLHMSTPNRPFVEPDGLTPNMYSSTRELIEDTEKVKGTTLDQPIPYVVDDDQVWDGYVKDYQRFGKEKDAEMFETNYSPMSGGDEGDDIDILKERILFPDTHL